MPFCRDGAKVPQVLPGPMPPPRYQSLDTGPVIGRVGVRGRCGHRQKVIRITSSAWNPRHHLALYRFSLAPPSSWPVSARPGLLPGPGREGERRKLGASVELECGGKKSMHISWPSQVLVKGAGKDTGGA